MTTTTRSRLESLPRKVIIEILSRLNDLKSLTQCLSVSKLLASLVPFTTSVTVRIEEPLVGSPLPPSQPSIMQVCDYINTIVERHRAKVVVDVTMTPSDDRERNKLLEEFQISCRPITCGCGWTINSGCYLDGCLQYYVNAARQKLSNFKGGGVENIVIELPRLTEILYWELQYSYPMKYSFEYSGGPELVKSCSIFGCENFCYPIEFINPEMNKKWRMMKLGTEIEPASAQDIEWGVDLVVTWLGVCLQFALCFHPLLEELVREHETVQDVVIMSPYEGKARFHAGKDAIEKMRREKTSTESAVSMLMDNNALVMKAKMWYLPFLEPSGCYEVFETVCFGIATFGDNDQEEVLKKEMDAFFDSQLIELRSDPFTNAEMEMTKIMKMKKEMILMPPSEAQLDAVWLFNQDQETSDEEHNRLTQIYLATLSNKVALPPNSPKLGEVQNPSNK